MQQDQPKSYILFIANIPVHTTQRELHQLCKPFGRVQSIYLNTLKKIGTTFAFVQFEDMRDAYDACQGLNNTRFKEKTLRIEYRVGGVNDFKKFEDDSPINPGHPKPEQNIQQSELPLELENHESDRRQEHNKAGHETQNQKVLQAKIHTLEQRVSSLEKRLFALQNK